MASPASNDADTAADDFFESVIDLSHPCSDAVNDVRRSLGLAQATADT
jgi:hypothetical protein